MYLLSLETGGNQAYIFETKRLRNIKGASELLYRVGTSYVERALKAVSGRDFKTENILDEEKLDSPDFEVIIATSGKALLLAKDRDEAKKFIREWSSIVAEEAPGLDAVAVCSKNSFEPLNSLDEYVKIYRETEREMTLLKMREGSYLARFQRIPVVAECIFSGFPASRIENGRPISEKSHSQRAASTDSAIRRRMKELFPGNASEKILNGFEVFENSEWLAVIHADGNGLGQLFKNFGDHVKKLVKDKPKGRDYINYYRRFSSALDEISRRAFSQTVNEIWGWNDKPPIIPIVVGGDDLTVIMGGYDSLKFAERFMIHFCNGTQNNPDTEIILNCINIKRLGMCAGISIAKPHFPFSQSYSLAEELMRSAKLVKNQYGKDSIAVDFHILYDSVASPLSEIREKLNIDGRILTQKPYVISQGQTRIETADNEWQISHDYGKFKKTVEVLKNLPSTQAHVVRDDLFSQHMETQEAEWQFILNSYPKFGRKWEEANNNSHLYIKTEDEKYSTVFLDALEMKKFLDDKENKTS